MRISVLTPTIQGREELLRRATYSVRWQTWKWSVEHVVVDNTGRPPAEGFQRCLDQALGTLIMPLADDDWLAPHALETLAGQLDENRNGHVDFASAQTFIGGKNLVVGHKLDEQAFRNVGFDIGGAHMWRKTLTDRHGGFDTSFPNAADYELYWRLSKVATPAFIEQVLYFYHDHPETDGNVSRDIIDAQCAQIRELHL